MGKKSKSSGNLGRALIKDRFGHAQRSRKTNESTMIHTSELNDGYDWGRLNLQSVTEESSFQEFLSTAQLAGTEFQAEKMNLIFVNPKTGVGLPSEVEKKKIRESHEKHKKHLRIPRRPKWTASTTAEQLDLAERDEFINWRRELALLQEAEGVVMTPYEKNIEFWRQLWRVVERSDVVVQIVDARNPLLFRCEDLEQYVKEVDSNKQNMILLNKSDFLTVTQRKSWADYFGNLGIRVAFFSAISHDIEKEIPEEEEDFLSASETMDSEGSGTEFDSAEEEISDVIDNDLNRKCGSLKLCDEQTESATAEANNSQMCDSGVSKIKNSHKIVNREELINIFRTTYSGPQYKPGVTTIGMVGYPNVGKSSTINTLLTYKKVSVSATPGKTKHFQTLFLDQDLLLCDCPGLVMPSFVVTKAEMVVSGILPVDQLRDHVPPVNLVTSVIPRHILEDTYGIMLPKPLEGEDPNRPPTTEELLNAYGYNRGFMTQNGQPDNPRSARYILKDFVNGKLLYCHAPPGYNQEEFHKFSEQRNEKSRVFPQCSDKFLKPNRVTSLDLDRTFFAAKNSGIHVKGNIGVGATPTNSTEAGAKPWKDHKNKRNKREKLRRVYAHLDQ